MGPRPDAAIRRRRALLGESRNRREREGGAEGDQCDNPALGLILFSPWKRFVAEPSFFT